MSEQQKNQDTSLNSLIEKINSLERRITDMETKLYVSGIASPSKTIDAPFEKKDFIPARTDDTIPEDESSIESAIGGSGLAWLGNIVLLVGVTFLIQYLQGQGFGKFSILVGYAAVMFIFFLSFYTRKHHADMAFLFSMNGHLLLYYVTLRLHFFMEHPILQNKNIVIALLAGVTAWQIFLAIREKSEVLAGLGLILAILTGIFSNSTHFMLPVSIIVAAASVWFLYRFGWWRLLIISLVIVYLVQLIWLVDNPVMSHHVKLISGHHFGFIYLFVAAAVFSLLALMHPKELFPRAPVITAVILNGLGFSVMILLYTLSFFRENYIYMFGSVTLFCLTYSVILKIRSEWKITSALYALYSFMALSVTVYGIYGFPRSFMLLSLQSLLVVSMALWFRSKAIVVMNTLLFIILLIAYLFSKEHLAAINFSFALVALITARVLNWKKGLLEIKTEMLRNTYLFTGFFMLLYALYKSVPVEYVTLSWTLAALLFFLLSILIRNVKYRYLALGTMIAAAFYFFIVDLSRVDLAFRIIALMFLALISLGVSLYYRKRLRKKPMDS